MRKRIKSKENGHYKDLKKLRNKKHRDSSGLFLAEGIKFLEYHPPVKEIILAEGTTVNKLPADIPAVELSRTLFRELSSQEHSQGVILLCYQDLNEEKLQEDKILILDDIRDPGNLGMILRVADATNYKEVVLTRGSVDPYHEKAVRSSMGSLFHVRLKVCERRELYKELKESGYTLYMTALHGVTIDYRKTNWKQKHAVIFGNEGHGLSDETLSLADEVLGVPIYGKAESLNVAVSAGIVLYESANRNQL